MEGPSPARLYASLAGAVLTIAGIVGFFYSASLGSPGNVDDALGAFAVNGWINLLHIATGALGLWMASFAARRYALYAGALYTAIAVWGFVVGGGGTILSLIPLSVGDNFLHLALGALGLAAAFGTPARVGTAPAT
ncbi:MAG TPA: DUF4383 domain-containing protein [Solirubrobacterales bacterium]